MNDLLIAARKNKYAIGGFNFNFYDDALGIVLGAYELSSPAFLMASEGTVKFLGVKKIVNYVKQLKEDFNIPIVLHLDHGKNIEIIKECIKDGFDSIMYDGSLLDFENNIKNTRMIAELCHDRGIPLEGELGRISGIEENVENIDDVLTDPDSVVEFIERSKVDSLAIAIGNAHGLYKDKPKLDFERLSKINDISSVPLVLHGGTGIPLEDIKKAIKLGISKVNIGTEIKITYFKTIKRYIGTINKNDVRHLISTIQNDIKELVKQYIEIFGSFNRI
ncbi:fructose-bisphosphate aldolase, class II [Thermoanaerobacter thermohydrosulfuricus]|uniref:Ketose-bisphosphate aldolase n=2 Tax=Thermoanaerobacter thermohydrosulfuricus TaxID=1516 RepID=M8DSN5_THETY|nr:MULTISPECIES: class II fructose-bisphosphate aldolase [Thermoanaerobacter]EMT39521.1 ketose-bisphosphate aldolase [Thermoanaerobacter thermohydrosulfuricus WC1]SDG05668.1 fructose-bisphosphate aldolase, class II [Thermoanaerobacter thermohydrosulfuricus]